MGRDFLGSIPVSSDLGFCPEVQLLDDCQGTFNWGVTGTGGDDVHGYTTDAAFAGVYGMKLKTRTTGAAAADWVRVTRWLGMPEWRKVWFRLRLQSPSWAAILSANLLLEARVDGRRYGAELRYLPGTSVVGRLNSAGGYTTIAGLGFAGLAGLWVGYGMCLDLTQHVYREAFANGVRVDLAGAALYDYGANTGRNLEVAIEVKAAGAAPAQVDVCCLFVGDLGDV